jgi:hypothetical protein
MGSGGASLTVYDNPNSGGACFAKVNATPNNWTALKTTFGAVDPTNFAQCPVSAYVTASAGGGGGGAKTGDLNNDTVINIFDLSILLSNYGKTKAQASNPACDLNSDNTINIFDLSILLSNYGK